MRPFALAASVAAVAIAVAGCGGGGGSKSTFPAALLHPEKLTAKSPQRFAVVFKTTKGSFTVSVHRSWAPRGADRFYNLVQAHFFDGARFFRVVPGFVVQFGISPFPDVSKAWETATIQDDPVTAHNVRGAVTYAAAGPNTRTTQIFINLGNNASLDSQGFAPFGTVTSGMRVVDALYSGYGDAPTPQQSQMAAQGNPFLDQHYPKLDGVETARVTG